MATRDERFPRRFLKAVDFESGDSELTISAVYDEEFEDKDGKKEHGIVLSFEGMDMELRCNPTNWDLIAAQHGANDSTWKGKKIVLGSQIVKSFGEMKPAIRVTAPAKPVTRTLPGKKPMAKAPSSEAEAQNQAADDNVPF